MNLGAEVTDEIQDLIGLYERIVERRWVRCFKVNLTLYAVKEVNPS